MSQLARILQEIKSPEPEIKEVVSESNPPPKGFPERSVEKVDLDNELPSASDVRTQMRDFENSRRFLKSMMLRGHLSESEFISFLERASIHIKSQMKGTDE